MLNGYPTPGGQTLYSRKEIEAFLYGRPEEEEERPVRAAHYARSSNGSKKLINSQFEKLRETRGEPLYEIRDSGSGLNENRKGLQKLMELAEEGKIDVIRITQKDRLSRFGNTYLERYFKAFGVEVEPVFEDKKKDLNQELLEDFMSLLASFSGKFYRMRGYKEQRRLLEEAEGILQKKEEEKDGSHSESEAS